MSKSKYKVFDEIVITSVNNPFNNIRFNMPLTSNICVEVYRHNDYDARRKFLKYIPEKYTAINVKDIGNENTYIIVNHDDNNSITLRTDYYNDPKASLILSGHREINIKVDDLIDFIIKNGILTDKFDISELDDEIQKYAARGMI